MSYSQSQTIQANDFNSLAGTTASNIAYSSSALATQKVAALLGVGYGDRGYGLQSPKISYTISPKSTGDVISKTEWLNLRNSIETISLHQGTPTTLLPPTSRFAIGSTIYAESTPATPYSFATMITNIDNNRFNTNGGASMSISSSVGTFTRGTAWGSGNTGITCQVKAMFASEDEARYFFNTGGEIRFIVSHPIGSVQDNNWNSVLANVGTIAFKAHSTTRSGTSATPNTSLGYYELTTSDQIILSGIIGTGAYSSNSILVKVRADTITGANGAKGSQIIFTISLTDAHNTGFTDSCSSGTAVAFSLLKASVYIPGITSPSISLYSAWA